MHCKGRPYTDEGVRLNIRHPTHHLLDEQFGGLSPRFDGLVMQVEAGVAHFVCHIFAEAHRGVKAFPVENATINAFFDAQGHGPVFVGD